MRRGLLFFKKIKLQKLAVPDPDDYYEKIQDGYMLLAQILSVGTEVKLTPSVLDLVTHAVQVSFRWSVTTIIFLTEITSAEIATCARYGAATFSLYVP